MEHLLKAVRDAAVFNPEVQVAPACILWPDRDRQWETIIPRLQAELPELFILGDYTPDKRSGPAIWLRCVIAGKTDEESLPMKHTPIFYLPGVSRQDLRAVESCPDYLKPLAELQYRGVIWSQINAKDWTILAYLKSDQGGLAAGTAEDLAAGYGSNGWKADDAVIRALSLVEKPADLEAISTAICSVYKPWAEESARHLQKVVDRGSYPGGTITSSKLMSHQEDECILFVDGLRFDTAKRLVGMLEKNGCTIIENRRWAALPSVTGTGKPAVAPLSSACSVSEEPDPSEFQVLTPYQFDKALKESGWLIIRPKDPVPSPIIAKSSVYSVAASVVNKLWVEFGDIDHEGHDRGWKLAKHIDALLVEIRDRIAALLAAGWKNVRVVTDHGWLLLPGGLPKIEMPACLADSKWGRCASLKPGATIEERLYPWYWNPNQHFALADGISCFKKDEEYTHGGLSLQECLTLELIVTQGTETGPVVSVEFTDVVWKGLRCTVAVDGSNSQDYHLIFGCNPAIHHPAWLWV